MMTRSAPPASRDGSTKRIRRRTIASKNLYQPFAAKQGTGARFAPAEADIQNFGMLAPPLRQNKGFIIISGFPVIEAAFLEQLERIGIQYLGPFIAVISGGIPTGEQVTERDGGRPGKPLEQGCFRRNPVLEFRNVGYG